MKATLANSKEQVKFDMKRDFAIGKYIIFESTTRNDFAYGRVFGRSYGGIIFSVENPSFTWSSMSDFMGMYVGSTPRLLTAGDLVKLEF